MCYSDTLVVNPGHIQMALPRLNRRGFLLYDTKCVNEEVESTELEDHGLPMDRNIRDQGTMLVVHICLALVAMRICGCTLISFSPFVRSNERFFGL